MDTVLNFGGRLNAVSSGKKRDADASVSHRALLASCVNPEVVPVSSLKMRDVTEPRGITRRQVVETAGHTTTDDFGTDGTSKQRS